MKRKSINILVVFVAAGIVCLGWFSWKNFRGALPAFAPIPAHPTSVPTAVNTTGLPLTIPPGFSVSVYAKNLDDPRVMAWDSAGTMLVSLTQAGKVVAIVSGNPISVLSGLNLPHGITFQGNTLYVAESDEVATYTYDPVSHTATNKQKIIDLPNKGFHFTRTIGFGPDGKLYTSIGSDCNVCKESDSRRAAIYVSNDDGSGFRPFATGLRNAVFFTWGPFHERMWATVMGRDYLGDDLPPDTIDIVEDGDNFGWPYCYGKKVWDSSFDASQRARDFCATTASSFIDYQAHAAPLGLAFIPQSWPKQYQNDLLVAMHGSWNRSVPTGYKIVLFKLDAVGNYLGAEDFITGWLDGNSALGRPVDLLFDQQGNLFISDDKAGVIYKVRVIRT